MHSQIETEKKIEKHLCTEVENVLKGIAYKFVSPQRRNVPDRLCILPGGFHFFVEVKSPGKRPTIGQTKEIARLRQLEHPVWVVDSKNSVDYCIRVVKRTISNDV